MTKNQTKTPKGAGFASAQNLFKNKTGHLDWENNEMRDRKAEARTRTIIDMQRLQNKCGKLRTLTLCGENLVHEQMLLDSTDLYGRLEELVCLEGDPKVYAEAEKRRRGLRPDWRNKITLVQAEDKQVLLATSGYKTEGLKGNPRKRIRPSLGFDMIWLDWMNSFGKGIDQTIGLMCDNISVFERAWNKGNPGLLYFTMACTKEEKADMRTLHLALSSFERDYRAQGLADDLFRVRYYGLGALLNQRLQIRGAKALASHGLFYREQKTHAMTMFFAGFDIYPCRRQQTGLPPFAEPEFLGVKDPQETR